MLTFCKIAVGFVLTMFIIPFFVIYKKSGETQKAFTRKALIIKLIVSVGLIVGFVLTFQTKVMFYPWKCVCFIGIVLVIEYIICAIMAHKNINTKMINKLISMWGVTLLCFILFTCASTIAVKAPRVYNEDCQIKEYTIKEVYSEEVEYVLEDGSVERISINEENVKIQFVEDVKEMHLVKKEKYRNFYKNPYAKDIEYYTDDNSYYIQYHIYIYNDLIND